MDLAGTHVCMYVRTYVCMCGVGGLTGCVRAFVDASIYLSVRACVCFQ